MTTTDITRPALAPTVEDRRPDQELDPGALRQAFGAFPSGVVAVAALVDGEPVGMAASSFTSVSLSPALVAFSVATASSTWPALRSGDHLGLSVLASHHDRACRQLAGPAAERFTGLSTRTTDRGALLLDDAVATFDCSVEREIEAGDHIMVLLRLHAVEDGGAGSPLVFHRSGFERLDGHAGDRREGHRSLRRVG
jgi:flavin reductase (DIM6/NTAB) family NADH-FMN oxidoreductase RutF